MTLRAAPAADRALLVAAWRRESQRDRIIWPMTQDLDAIARTARLTAAARARESEKQNRLFDDPYARVLAGDEGLALLDAEPPEAAGSTFLPIRTASSTTGCVDSRRRVSGRSLS